MNHSEIFLNKYEQNVVEDILTLKPGTDEYGKYWSWIARNETGFRHNGNTVRDFELRIYGKDLWRVLLMNREVIDFLATNNHDNWYHVNWIAPNSWLSIDLPRTYDSKTNIFIIMQGVHFWVDALIQKSGSEFGNFLPNEIPTS